jgi:hypothetical protein
MDLPEVAGGGDESGEALAELIRAVLPRVSDPQDRAELQQMAREEAARSADPSLPDAVGGHGHLGKGLFFERRATRRKIYIR